MAKRCRRCGGEVDAAAIVCLACGATRPARSRPERREETPARSHAGSFRKVYLGIALTVLVLMVLTICAGI